MKKKNRSVQGKTMKSFLLAVLFAVLTGGCSSELKKTTAQVKDPIRHYYPVMAGDVLSLEYEIANTGKAPLVISDIQTTCGCVVPASKRMVIPAGRAASLQVEYNSAKNVGYVEHEVLLYGNFDTASVCRLHFDLNVVPHADYTKDYEELYGESVHDRKPGNAFSGRKAHYYIDAATRDQ